MDVLDQAKHRVGVVDVDAAPMSGSSSTAPEASCSAHPGKPKLDRAGESENGKRMDVSVEWTSPESRQAKKSCQGKTKERERGF